MPHREHYISYEDQSWREIIKMRTSSRTMTVIFVRFSAKTGMTRQILVKIPKYKVLTEICLVESRCSMLPCRHDESTVPFRNFIFVKAPEKEQYT